MDNENVFLHTVFLELNQVVFIVNKKNKWYFNVYLYFIIIIVIFPLVLLGPLYQIDLILRDPYRL